MQIPPADRYQTPTEVVADLRRALANGEGLSAVAAAPSATVPPVTPTVIFVENRPKQQDALRDYFSSHGYRVLVLTDPLRALNRAESEPVQGLVLIGDALGDEVAAVYQAAVTRFRRKQVPVVLALSPKLAHIQDKVSDQPYARVLREQVTLRAIRTALRELSSNGSGAKDLD
jgi:CheY-like chemotaxis protein